MDYKILHTIKSKKNLNFSSRLFKIEKTLIILFVIFFNILFFNNNIKAETIDLMLNAHTWGKDGLLPFPSDIYTVTDDSRVTKKSVVLPKNLLTNDILSKAPFDASAVIKRLERHDGFSPSFPIMITIPANVDPANFPATELSTDKDSPLILMEAKTLKRISFITRKVKRGTKSTDDTLLVMQPEQRLENNTTYIVIIKNQLKDVNGNNIEPPPKFLQALNYIKSNITDNMSKHEREYFYNLNNYLKSIDIKTEDIATAFHFTTESKESYINPMLSLANQIKDQSSSYSAKSLSSRRRWSIEPNGATVVVKGSFEIIRFIDEPTGHLLDNPIKDEIPFKMTLPETCPESGCSIAVFGHGLSATKETMFQVANDLAKEGIATIAIGTLYHQNYLQSFSVLLKTKNNLEYLHAMFVEHVTRNLQLIELIKNDLSKRDFASNLWRSYSTPLKVRSDRIFYIGQSMGGICGVITTALSDDIKASVFDVAGGSIVDMVFGSVITKAIQLPIYTFKGLDSSDGNRLIPLALNLFNDTDSLGFAPFVYQDPIYPHIKRTVSQQAGIGDKIVPNWTSEKLRLALGIPVVRSKKMANDESAGLTGTGFRFFNTVDNWFFAHTELFFEPASNAVAKFFKWSMEEFDKNDNKDKTASYKQSQ